MYKKPTIGYMISNYDTNYKEKFRKGYIPEFQYIFEEPQNQDIVVFSDLFLSHAGRPEFKDVPYKVAWLMESHALFLEAPEYREQYNFVMNNLDLFCVVATSNLDLVSTNPAKFKYVPFGYSSIPRDDTFIWNKIKFCSMTSGVMCWKGHQKRIDVFNEFSKSSIIDFLGRGFDAPFTNWVDAFAPYMYHITIPNYVVDGYFVSHLLDALACGTVPIYSGCSNIGEYFDTDGFIFFDTVDDLKDIMNEIGVEDYYSRMSAIQENLKLVENYRVSDSNLWKNVLKDIYDNISNNN